MRYEKLTPPVFEIIEVDKEKYMNSNNNQENGKKDVLIMEDDHYITNIYSKALTRVGYSFDIAKTMDQARVCLDRNAYRVFICDVHMGNERGTDLLPEYKEIFAENNTKVVMASAYGNYRILAGEAGADFFLEKPISLGTLFTLIDRLLDAPDQEDKPAKPYYRSSIGTYSFRKASQLRRKQHD
jgi:DNA-binding NtrC family response regulator